MPWADHQRESLEQVLDHRERATHVLEAITAAIDAVSDFGAVGRVITERAIGLAGANGASLHVADERALVCRAIAGAPESPLGARADDARSHLARCLDGPRVVHAEGTAAGRARALVVVPLVWRGRAIAALEVAAEPRRSFATLDVAALVVVADCFGAALVHAQRFDALSRTEVALRNSRARLSATFSTLGEAVMAVDAKGAVLQLNRVAERFTGWHSSDARGKRVEQVVCLESEETHKPFEVPWASLDTEQRIELPPHVTLRSKDGKVVPVAGAASIVRDARGTPTGYAIVLRDVSDERRARDRELRRIVDRMRDGVALVRAQRVVFANDAFAHMLGLESAGALLSKRFEEFVDASDVPRARKLVGNAGERGSPAQLRLRRADGASITAEINVEPAVEFEGAPTALLVARDVTEWLKEQLKIQHADRIATIGRLLGGMAHEINNPLASIMSNLEFIGERLLDGEAAGGDSLHAVVQDARSGADRIRAVVAELAEFTRSEKEPHVPVDVAQTVRAAVKIAMNEIRHRGRFFEDIAETPRVLGEPSRLTQVFLNLLVNAATSLPEGKLDKNEMGIRAFTDRQGNATVEIYDNGPGIAPVDLEHVFEPFSPATAFAGGTGLGLAVSHSIVAAHGGRIVVESEAGRGTLFRVTLPPAPKAAARRESDAPPETRRGRVLVIDDDAAVGRSIRRALSSSHAVTVVTTAAQALERIAAREAAFDAIVCDLMMPEMSGVELHARLVETYPEYVDRILFVTGGAFSPSAQAFLAIPGVRHLPKPFTKDQLLAALQRILARP